MTPKHTSVSARRRKKPSPRSRARASSHPLLAFLGSGIRPVIVASGTVAMVAFIAVASIGIRIGSTSAAGGQVLKLVTPEGGSTYYVGRCFRTDIKVQTDSLNANSVDVIIPYNPSYLAPYTGSGCTTSATAINTNGLFPSYPYNSISGNQVVVTGYDASGTSPVNTGAGPADRVLGHIFWKVLAASGAYNMNFTFTLGSTIDTNMAESGGDGSDVLDSVQNLTLNLATDSTAPTFASQSPSNAATNVSVTSGVSYTFNDTGAGVNTGSLTVGINGTNRSKSFSSCTTTNSNRVTGCTVTVTGLGTLSYATHYQVTSTGSDRASPTPNEGSTTWGFTTEDDTNAPYLSGQAPANGATGVAVNNNIVFHVKDYKANAGVTPGLGVDINTVSVAVTEAGGSTITYTSASPQFSYTGTSADYTITINPTSDFAQNKLVTVVVNASDLHAAPANAMSPVTYSFTTVDSTAPSFASFDPTQNATDVAANSNVSFHILDGVGGAGVDINNTTVTVAGTAYTSASPQFSYTGTSSDYTITINPSSNFTGGQNVTVAISTRDLASTPNTASTSYSFSVASVCSTCFVDSESPARFSTTASLTNTISFRVKDTADGILSSSIRVVLIGTGAAFTSSPLTLTGSSPMVSITGTSADYLVTITLPASIEANKPVSINISATNVNGLSMPTVAYTVASITGGTPTIVTVTESCTQTATTSPGNGGGRSRTVSSILGSILSSDLPQIIARKRLPNNTLVSRMLGPDEISKVTTCYVDEDSLLHAAAPQTHYKDVEGGIWFEEAVKSLLDAGILDVTKETFRPNDSALRAEFSKVLALIGKAEVALPETPTFDDVASTDWFFPFIENVAGKGIMKGYQSCIGTHPCFTFPGAVISRAEAAAMIVRFYKYDSVSLAPAFADVAPEAWYASTIQAAADHCIVRGKDGLSLVRPNAPINRAEMVTMLDRARRNLKYGEDCSWNSAQ